MQLELHPLIYLSAEPFLGQLIAKRGSLVFLTYMESQNYFRLQAVFLNGLDGRH
jgi:hypothetical protein